MARLSSCRQQASSRPSSTRTNCILTAVLHTISNGGPSTASKYRFTIGEIEAWLVRTGIANLLSIPAIERKGFIVESHTLRDWVVTSLGGTRVVFRQDIGRCDRFPFVDLRDPAIERYLAIFAERILLTQLRKCYLNTLRHPSRTTGTHLFVKMLAKQMTG